MTPRQARRILRELNRRERRVLNRGLYGFSADGGRTFYAIDRHGIPRLICPAPVDPRPRIAAEWLDHA